MATEKPKTIDAYISSTPLGIRSKLTQLRKLIKATVPKAEERLSYGMPYYGYKGRLAYFAYAKTHLGLYIPPPVIAEHAEELKAYGTAKATVRFPLDQKLPITLIRKLLKARMKKNEEKHETKHKT